MSLENLITKHNEKKRLKAEKRNRSLTAADRYYRKSVRQRRRNRKLNRKNRFRHVDEWSNRRLFIMAALMLVAVCSLLSWGLVRDLVKGVVDEVNLSERVEKQWYSSVTAKPIRGTIYDSDGNVLAASATDTSVAVVRDSSAVNPEHRLVIEIAVSQGVSESYMNRQLAGDSEWFWVVRSASDENYAALAEAIEDGTATHCRTYWRGIIYVRSEDSNSTTENDEKIIKAAVELLGVDEEELRANFAGRKEFFYLKRLLTDEEAESLRLLDLDNLKFIEEGTRYYPSGSLAGQVIGYVQRYADSDGVISGVTGVEALCDEVLKGVPGSGRKLFSRYSGDEIEEEEPVVAEDGYDVTLTLDSTIQYIVEQQSQVSMEEYSAKGVYAIVSNVKTGAILAMVNNPSLDLNNLDRSDSDALSALATNKCVSYQVDPGSTFKVITAASALDSGAVSLYGFYYDCTGSMDVDGITIKCSDSYGHGHQNFFEATGNSCNPAFMRMALSMGKEVFYSYIINFGFGNTTGLGLVGERKGLLVGGSWVKVLDDGASDSDERKYIVDYEKVRGVDLARMGFGQSISVTPIQLTTAIAAVVNDGKLMQPYIVDSISHTETDVETGEQIRIIEKTQPTEVRRVISEETSDTMCEVLRYVVDEGGGSSAAVEGYAIGGKTGTAQLYSDTGGIAENKYLCSFVALYPADDPEYLVYYAVDEPQGENLYGNTVAGPRVKVILEQLFEYLRIEPTEPVSTSDVTVKSLIGFTRADVENFLSAGELEPVFIGTGDTVLAQLPIAGSQAEYGSKIMLYTGGVEDTDNDDLQSQVLMPDLTGLSEEECTAVLEQMGLKINAVGIGNAAAQDPLEGTDVSGIDTVTVWFTLDD